MSKPTMVSVMLTKEEADALLKGLNRQLYSVSIGMIEVTQLTDEVERVNRAIAAADKEVAE